MPVIRLPTIGPANSVEACAAPLAYLAWVAWPWPDQADDRDMCFKGGLSSCAKAAGVRLPEFPDSMKGWKPKRVDDKLNKAFEIAFGPRLRALAIAKWAIGEDLSQLAARRRLVEWSVRKRGLSGDDGSFSAIRQRVWDKSLPAIPMATGFLYATGYMTGAPMPKAEIIRNPEWLPVAVNICDSTAAELRERYPETDFVTARLR